MQGQEKLYTQLMINEKVMIRQTNYMGLRKTYRYKKESLFLLHIELFFSNGYFSNKKTENLFHNQQFCPATNQHQKTET